MASWKFWILVSFISPSRILTSIGKRSKIQILVTVSVSLSISKECGQDVRPGRGPLLLSSDWKVTAPWWRADLIDNSTQARVGVEEVEQAGRTETCLLCFPCLYTGRLERAYVQKEAIYP